MNDLAAHIARSWGAWDGPLVESIIFGTRKPEAIAATIESWVLDELGTGIDAVHAYFASVGATAVLGLSDGRDVAVKVHQPRLPLRYLEAVHVLHEHLFRSRFPCAEPITGPRRCGAGWATVAARVELPESAVAPDVVSSMAALARLTLYANDPQGFGVEPAALQRHPFVDPAEGSPYPDPHHPAIHFSPLGSDPFDPLAVAAHTVLQGDRGESVVTHADWAPRNVFGDTNGVAVVLDLDSAMVCSDARAAGMAAASWSLDTAGEDGVGLAELERLSAVYQRIRDQWFDESADAVFWAAALARLCYIGRCERAVGAPGVASSTVESIGEQMLGRATRSA